MTDDISRVDALSAALDRDADEDPPERFSAFITASCEAFRDEWPGSCHLAGHR